MENKLKLVIGNKAISSWSLRPWIVLKYFQISFEEILIKLDLHDTTENIKKYSPTGKVPALIDGDLVVFESVAIMEYLNEKFPEKKMLPKDIKDRAQARSLMMEMHAGFFQMREILSFNNKKRHENFNYSMVQADIDRMTSIWEGQLKKSGGPFLFGHFTLVDAMYAPIPFRYQTYGVEVEGLAKKYCETLLSLPAMKEWYEAGLAEKFIAEKHI